MNHRLVFGTTYLALTQAKHKVSHHLTQSVLRVYIQCEFYTQRDCK